MKILYFFYALKKTSYNKLFKYIIYVNKTYNKGILHIVIDFIKDFFVYNTLFLDYFYFRFFEMNQEEKETYIDTLSMFKFQGKFNDKKFINFFSDKSLFYKKFKPYVKHNTLLIKHFIDFEQWMDLNKPKGIVCKSNLGQVGMGIEVFDVEIKNNNFVVNGRGLKELYNYLLENKLNLVEERIKQHDELAKIYPNSLNTVRVITFLKDSGEVEILGSILRMGFDKAVDNFDAGGISVVVDEDGVIRRKAIIKNPIVNKVYEKHPFTNIKIAGVKIPYWNEVIELVKNAAQVIKEVRTVGWDVVITNEGVSLLEGNHNWDKTHWQLCYGKGMKNRIKDLISNG